MKYACNLLIFALDLNIMQHFVSHLKRPMDNSALIVFRIFFGALMFFESIGALVLGWVKQTFVTPDFTFHFFGFDFLQALVGPQMYLVYVAMALFAIMVAFGYRYRLAIIVFTILWAMTYFNQKTHYNNHYYLILLISFLMCLVPANTYASADVQSGRVEASLTCPKWATRIFMLQVAIVYFYAAVAKLYPDWLVGKPIEIWLTHKSYQSFLWNDNVAQFLSDIFSKHSTHLFLAYMGIIFDFLVIPFFMWNKWSRWLALISSLVFHLTNSALFHIGVFPYFALSFVIFYFEPETIRQHFLKNKPQLSQASLNNQLPVQTPSYLMPILLVYFFIQILLPLRHHAIPGNVLWDESGHRLSWRMMLRTKYGRTQFYVTADGLEKERINTRDYIRPHQINDAYAKPDIMWPLAQHIAKDYRDRGYENVRVFIDSKLSVNDRPLEQFTNPDFNVADVSWQYFNRQPWVLHEPEGFKNYWVNQGKARPTD